MQEEDWTYVVVVVVPQDPADIALDRLMTSRTGSQRPTKYHKTKTIFHISSPFYNDPGSLDLVRV